MPLYVYECAECAIELEELRPAARADEPVECPICHALCTRALTTFALGRDQSAAPVYGQLPSVFHGIGCGCCGPRRR